MALRTGKRLRTPDSLTPVDVEESKQNQVSHVTDPDSKIIVLEDSKSPFLQLSKDRVYFSSEVLIDVQHRQNEKVDIMKHGDISPRTSKNKMEKKKTYNTSRLM